MNFEESIDWLYGTQLFGIKLGLDNVRRLFEERKLFPALEGRKIVHVAGTNGKGSVCAMVDSISRAAGKKSGLFTSPHLVSFRERIRVDGELIPEKAVARILSEIRDQVEAWDPHPTFFEITTALAVEHFCETGCDVLVMETGMGGRLDATNVLPPDVCVITPIGMDHRQWLGPSLAEIAAEKAGIIKPGVPVFSAEQEPEALEIIEKTAADRNAELTVIPAAQGKMWPVALAGRHQQDNACLAVAALRALIPETDKDQIGLGLSRVEWPARFQRIEDRLVIDGAHNLEATEALVRTWRDEFEAAKCTLIFGGVEKKDTDAVLKEISEIASGVIFVGVKSKRGVSITDLQATWERIGDPSIPVHPSSGLSEAIEIARRNPELILITGSLYLAGEALAELQGGVPFEVSEQ